MSSSLTIRDNDFCAVPVQLVSLEIEPQRIINGSLIFEHHNERF